MSGSPRERGCTREGLAAAPIARELLHDLLIEQYTSVQLESLDATALYKTAVGHALSLSAQGREVALTPPWPPELRGETDVPIEALADVLLRSSVTAGWSATWEQSPQLWVSESAQAPIATIRSKPAEGKPEAALWTSSMLSDGTSAWLPVAESGVIAASDVRYVWQIEFRRDAQVFEIRSAQDWRRLCDRYGRVGPHSLLHPDWQAVSEEYDGVHLSIDGLVCGQGVPVSHGGSTSLLWGWDAECTAWLRYCVENAVLVGELSAPARGSLKAPSGRRWWSRKR